MASRRAASEVDISAREAEVLAAVGEHLTNAEIGARLFISARTVESHVSSLLRKLQVGDRRALAAVAASRPAPPTADEGDPSTMLGRLPAPLTSFVGRIAERAALIDALDEHRLVTAVGPGGVGKTRLALSVAAEVADRFTDGVWFVDLVPVTEPAMIASAIAVALGLGEYQGRSAEDTVVEWLAGRETLLVLDNCEHLLDGVVVLLERLLADCRRLSVLATSRARLLVPFEWVFPVPGLSLEADDDGPGDAVELFLERAAAGGSVLAVQDRPRVAAVCRGLDGMALAIELAAARVASLGLDGIEAGLADRLRLLTGARRAVDRHRSLRSSLGWSYAQLAEADRAVLRRVSVFAAAFTARAAESVVAGWPPVTGATVPTILAGLTDQSLLVAIAAPDGTRYRALETIRQYSVERLNEADESVEALSRHLSWCLAAGAALEPLGARDVVGWRSQFDQVADELRSALSWAADTARYRPDAHRLAIMLADLSFARGLPGESQWRYEQAAELAPDGKTAAAALDCAAGAAESRSFGTEALRLRRAAASAAIRAGDRAAAAADLARAAELINRVPGMMSTRPSASEVKELLAQGWALAAGDVGAQARLLTAEAFSGDEFDPLTAELADRAIMLARHAGDPLTESAALDQLTTIQLARGEVRTATATALRRLELLATMRVTPLSGLEFADAHGMAVECSVAAGDLRTARRLAERARDLPFHREEGHLATARLIVVTALVGDWDETVALAERFREGWERAGRQRAGVFSRAAYAAATIHGMRGDDEARAAWLNIVDALVTPGRSLSDFHFSEFFDALLLLHRGLAGQAIQLLDTPPRQLRAWNSGMWRPWYAALWAEAAVLTDHDEASDRIHQAGLITVDNPIAAAIVHRAAALARDRDRDELITAAAALQAAGCRYQWARTLVFIGSEHRLRGDSALAAMHATPMAVPPERC